MLSFSGAWHFELEAESSLAIWELVGLLSPLSSALPEKHTFVFALRNEKSFRPPIWAPLLREILKNLLSWIKMNWNFLKRINSLPILILTEQFWEGVCVWGGLLPAGYRPQKSVPFTIPQPLEPRRRSKICLKVTHLATDPPKPLLPEQVCPRRHLFWE